MPHTTNGFAERRCSDAYNYIGSGEKTVRGPIQQMHEGRKLRKGKGKKTEEKAASVEGFESIERKD